MNSIINVVQHSKILYNCYYYIGSLSVWLLKKFLKEDDKLIVFNSFGGRKYDDSPKALYLKMIDDPRFKEYKFVWAFRNANMFTIPKGKTVKIDSISYYITILKARVWITNTTMTRALNFKGINTFSLNTWHGSAIKKIGGDAIGNSTFVSKGESKTDVYLAQGEYDKKIFSKAFGIDSEKIKAIGLPRNDELAVSDIHIKAKALRDAYMIPQTKKVILYAPTFREYEREGANYTLSLPINWDKWRMSLGEQYMLLLRAHPAIVNKMDIKDNGFVIDVSRYEHLNDLMILSDMLISDYSSIFFDYAIQGKPMFCFSYDYERYEKERGMYFDIRKELNNECLDTEDKLLSAILNMNIEERIATSKRFRDKYVQKYGTAIVDSLNIVYNAIK